MSAIWKIYTYTLHFSSCFRSIYILEIGPNMTPPELSTCTVCSQLRPSLLKEPTPYLGSSKWSQDLPTTNQNIQNHGASVISCNINTQKKHKKNSWFFHILSTSPTCPMFLPLKEPRHQQQAMMWLVMTIIKSPAATCFGTTERTTKNSKYEMSPMVHIRGSLAKKIWYKNPNLVSQCFPGLQEIECFLTQACNGSCCFSPEPSTWGRRWWTGTDWPAPSTAAVGESQMLISSSKWESEFLSFLLKILG